MMARLPVYTWLTLALFLVLPGITLGPPRDGTSSPPPRRLFSCWSSTSCSTSYENCGNSRHMALNSGSASWRKLKERVAQNAATGLRIVASSGLDSL